MSAAAPDTIAIPARYNGPPVSANGGYTCGTVARLLAAPAAEVSLRRPPPLERALAVERAKGGDGGTEAVRLFDGDELVAEGRALPGLELEPPDAVPVAAAAAATASFPWYEGHPFPTCFVCGPQRDAGDGLRIFAGALPQGELFASSWTPAGDLADGRRVREEVVWAALDCPTAVAAASQAASDAGVAVLASLAGSVDAEVRAGEPHAVVSWPLGRDGRKRTAGSAILDAGGAVLARARALWIELRE